MFVKVTGLDTVKKIRAEHSREQAAVTLPSWAVAVILQAEVADVRYVFGTGGDEDELDDDTGFLLTAGAGPIRLEGSAIRSLDFLEASVGAILNVGVLSS